VTAVFRFGARSQANLRGVHHELVNVVSDALLISTVDFAVIEGLRTYARQRELYSQGRTKIGNIVTWTMSSKHMAQADGFGHAVDLLPVNPATGKIDAGSWNYRAGFVEIANSMFEAADRLGVKIRWGKDWNMNGKAGEKGETDSPHFELMG